jgi:uncharacterized Zn finger protein (UPF0148 family)
MLGYAAMSSSCPKCGWPQVEVARCPRCGVEVARYRADKRALHDLVASPRVEHVT